MALTKALGGSGGGGITQLTGDVTAGPGSGSQAATIANASVGVAKLSATGTPSSTTFLRGDNTWNTPAGATAGIVRLDRQVLGAAAASITFSSISGAYSALRVVLVGRSDYASATFSRPRLRMNADSGSNYNWSRHETTGVSSSQSDGSTSATFIDLGHVPAPSGPANYVGSQIVDILEYAGTAFYKSVHYHNAGSAVGSFFSSQGIGWWKSTSAITSLTLILDNGNYLTGTVATLYGIV